VAANAAENSLGAHGGGVALGVSLLLLLQAWVLLTEAQPECSTSSNKFDIADVGQR